MHRVYLAHQPAPMRYMKWIGLAAAALLIVACFLPWYHIVSRDIVISGTAAPGTNFGKPGYFHLLLAGLFLVFHFTPRIWAKRLNLLVGAINLAWALKNFFLLAACSGGECPVRLAGSWLLLVASIGLLVAALLPDMKTGISKK